MFRQPGVRPIEIACIFDNYFPKIGGGATQNRMLVESICREKDVRMKVFPMVWAKGLEPDSFPYPLHPVRTYESFPKDFNRVTTNILLDRITTLLLAKRIVPPLVETSDIVHTDLHSAAIIGAFLKYRFGKKLIIRFGGNLFRENEKRYEVEDKYHPLKSLFFEWPARVVFKAADTIIVNGADLRNELLRAGVDPRKITIIPVGVDPRIFHPPRPEKDPLPATAGSPCRLLFFGRITEANGPFHFLRILEILSSADITLEAKVVGEGSLLPAMKTASKKMGFPLTFVSPQTQECLSEHIRDSHFCVFPFRKIGGVSNVVVESMACGRPVFTADTGDLKRLVVDGRTGFLSSVDNPEEMAQTILQVLKDPSIQISAGREAARTVSEKYRWDEIKKEYLSLYRTVLSGDYGPQPQGAIAAREREAC